MIIFKFPDMKYFIACRGQMKLIISSMVQNRNLIEIIFFQPLDART